MRTVTHHAHHPDEGVYRLVHAAPVVGLRETEDEDGEKTVTEEVVGHVDHRDIVWADDDERWHGKSHEEIAVEQHDDVREALARAERDAKTPESEIIHLGTAGQTL